MTDNAPTPLPPPVPEATPGGPPPLGGSGQSRPRPARRSKLSDDALLKRADYGGKSLLALAVLAGVASLGLVIASVLVPAAARAIIVPAIVPVAVAAAGYGLLAAAARQGNPNALGAAITVLFVQIALSFTLTALAAGPGRKAAAPTPGGCLIPILILVALWRDRNILLELRARGLWERAFGLAKPSRRLCLAGTIALATGMVSLNGAMALAGWQAGQMRRADRRHAESFMHLVKTEDRAFVSAMQAVTPARLPAAMAQALTRLEALEQALAILGQEIARDRAQPPAGLETYRQAVARWRAALRLLQPADADLAAALDQLRRGDRLRQQAFQEFDRRYVRGKPQTDGEPTAR